MEAGRNEGKGIQSVGGLTDSLPPRHEDTGIQKLTLLRQMSEGLKKAIDQLKAGKTEEIAALMEQQENLMRSIDALDQSSTSPDGNGIKDMQQKELSLIKNLNGELTILIRTSMEEAKEALIKIKNQKELRDIRQQMQIPFAGSLMDRTIK